MGESKWAFCSGLPLVVALCLLVHTQSLSAPLAPCSLADIDSDDDGLIEVCDIEALDAIRYQLDGSGYRPAATAAKITAGCSLAEGCKGYELVTDLDFNDVASYRDVANKDIWSHGDGWLPIGDSLNPFAAIFNGNNHTVSNLRIHRNADNMGLFGSIGNAAEIDHLELSEVDIKGDFWVAALVSYNQGKITRSRVASGNLVGKGGIVGALVATNDGIIADSTAHVNVSGRHQIGGLVGVNTQWIINSCVHAKVVGRGEDVGGLVGHNSGSIINSCARGTIASTASNVGGLVGNNRGSLTNSYAVSRVVSEANNVGGLVGLNDGLISDVYVWSNTQESNDVQGHYRVGGLVGHNRNSVTNGYATARVAGVGYSGGLIGLNYRDGTAVASTATHSYWHFLSGQANLIAGDGFRTTEQLQSPIAPGDTPQQIYYGWDTRNWNFGGVNHYPLLKYAETTTNTKPIQVSCTRVDNLVPPPSDEYMVANCGDLLPWQYTRLSNLVISDGITLRPAFNAEVFNYQVVIATDIEQLRLIAYTADADADISVISNAGIAHNAKSGHEVTVSLDRTMDNNLITIARQYKIAVVYPLRITGVPPTKRVNEGERMRLEVSSGFGSDTNPYHYQWRQLSGLPLLSGLDLQQPVLEIEVAKDFVANTITSTQVVLQVHVSDDIVSDSAMTTLTIVKVANGAIPTQLAAPTFIARTFQLIAPELSIEILSQDADGIAAIDILGYQWQYKADSAISQWHDIDGATKASYDIAMSSHQTNHIHYRVRINYRDGQGYTNNSAVSAEFILPIADIDIDDDGLIEIYYLEDLAAMRYQLDGSGYRANARVAEKITTGCPAAKCIGYELARDLDFNSDDSYRDINNKSKWVEYGAWQPLSDAITKLPFTATFDGNNKTISNFKMYNSQSRLASLFGYVRAKIMNLGLLNVDIKGPSYIGGLASYNEGIITNCYVTGDITLVANNEPHLIVNNPAGGLVAVHGNANGDGDAIIINSFASVNIIGSAKNVGGLVATNHAMIINSYAHGSIQGAHSNIGGLVGIHRQSGTILNSYARGRVAGDGYLGGLVGYSQGNIIHSFAAVAVLGNAPGGGLIGLSDATATVINSYWDSLASGLSYSAGGTSKTTTELHFSTAADSTTQTDAYYRWDDDDWDFGSRSQYPILKYAPLPAALASSVVAPDYAVCSMVSNDDSTLPMCGIALSDRRHGLVDLELLTQADVVMLAALDRLVLEYQLTVVGADNQLRLIPTALDRSAVIRVSVNGSIVDKDIKSATTSSAIFLSSTNVTQITIEVRGKVIDHYTLNVHYIPFADVDMDDDGLIEIRKLEDLNAMRYNLYGTAYQAAADTIATTAGCPENSCRGYELITDLDFNEDADYREIKNKALWTNGNGWQPIGSSNQTFQAIFQGNSKVITGLTINRPEDDEVALFGALGADGEVDGVGLLNVNILGKHRVGGLVATNLLGTISNSYANGTIRITGNRDTSIGGGLVALNSGVIKNSYAIGHIVALNASAAIGGLVGWNLHTYSGPGMGDSEHSGLIMNSYAVGKIDGGRYAGGLVGRNSDAVIIHSYAIADTVTDDLQAQGLVGKNENGSVVASYWDTTVANIEDTNIINSVANAIGLTSEILKSPTVAGSTITQAYFDWSDSNWDFGNDQQYPVLKYNHNRCNDPVRPPCNTLFANQIGNHLSHLILSAGSGLVPAFEPLQWDYDMYVSADIEFVQLTPIAHAATSINLYIDDVFMEHIHSGASSSPILLTEEFMITIVVTVTDGSLCEYTIEVNPLDTIVRDIDADDDGLIELSNIEELNEIRYQPDGRGYRANDTAPIITIGCPPQGCSGYELDRDLDFDDIASYRHAGYQDIANMNAWTRGHGWQPIQNFNGVFKANNKTISNLTINQSDRDAIGLFANTGRHAVIEGVALLDVEVVGNNAVGGLVGNNLGVISNSYIIAKTISGNEHSGGLVGSNHGTINNSYASVNLSGNRNIGGLVGSNNATINNSYTSGNVMASYFGGGLIGRNEGVVVNSYTIATVSPGQNGALIGNNEYGRIENSYWNIDIALPSQHNSAAYATTVQLKSSTEPGLSAPSIYFNWSNNDWDFGTANQYPALKYRDDDCTETQPLPPCDTLLSNQYFGLINLELSDGATLFPSFHREVLDYDITLDAGQSEFGLIATAANSAASIEIKIDEAAAVDIANGVQSHPIAGHSSHLNITVKEHNRESLLYTARVHRLSFVVTDIDQDNDGLIEINDVEALNAIRYQLDGRGYRESNIAPLITVGCRNPGCNGYELTRDLNFNDINSYRPAATHQQTWYHGEGWPPLGDGNSPFNAIFEGNGYTISNLNINKPDADYVGLFGSIGRDGRIENLGLLNLTVSANNKVGALAGVNGGVISNSYAVGSIAGRGSNVGGIVGEQRSTAKIVNSYTRVKVSGSSRIGGLVGLNSGCIGGCYAIGSIVGSGHRIGGLVGSNAMGMVNNSYAVGKVSGNHHVGGFVGSNAQRGRVVNNYAVGSVLGNHNIGGFIASNSTDSILFGNYWDAQSSGITTGTLGSRGVRSLELRTPTTPSIAIYHGWHRDVWDFGSATQYPHLKYVTTATAVSTAADHPACAISVQSRNANLLGGQNVGLSNLELVTTGFHLYPHFARTLSNYQLTVSADTTYLRLMPTAYASNANIYIHSNTFFDEMVASATTTAAISLHPTTATVIAIDVQVPNDGALRYVITVNRLAFALVDNKVDNDGDGLIDINYLEDLYAMRYSMDGSGYRVSPTAGLMTAGCPAHKCRGYELLRDLSFKDDGSYRNADAHKKRWRQGTGWLPIGNAQATWNGVFDGNHKTISDLAIDRATTNHVGLFGVVGQRGRIANIALSDATIVGRDGVGILAGMVGGAVSNSNALGSVRGRDKVGGLVGEMLMGAALINSHAHANIVAVAQVGGLIGRNSGRISVCYAAGNVVATGDDSGGFVGHNFGGFISNSYALANVRGSNHVGGFIGRHQTRYGGVMHSYAVGNVHPSGSQRGGFGAINQRGQFTANYWNKETSGSPVSIAGSHGFTTTEMQSPMLPTHTIYVGWSSDIWDFGTSQQYPKIKYITGGNVADLFKDSPACGISVNLPPCRTTLSDQHIVLADLALIPDDFTLSPHFGSSLHQYQATIFSATDALQVIATTHDADADIRLSSSGGITELLTSATTSSVIPLSVGSTTVLVISVHQANKRAIEYTIELTRLGFAVTDNRIDNDGDGLIDINYLEDLYAMRYQLDGSGYRAGPTASKITSGCPARGCNGYELLRNLDFTNNNSYRFPIINKQVWRSGQGWLPIANEDHPFNAIFNGNNKTIAYLTINRPNTNAVGLFGSVGGSGRIDGVGLSAVSIIGNNRVGALAGMSNAPIVNSFADGKVVGRRSVGGLVGKHNATIVNSYTTTQVTGDDYVGGLVGLNSGRITGCYTVGSTTGKGYDIGGFIGSNINGVVRNNYALGWVSGKDRVGGFVGINKGRGTIMYNYATAKVSSGGANIGGFSGMNSGFLFLSNYWDRQASGISSDIVGNLGLDTISLKSLPTENIYADWNSTTWHFEAGLYPHLKHVPGVVITNLPSSNPACDTTSEFVCGTLIAGQRIGLTDLKMVSQDITLFPNFDNRITTYRTTVYADTLNLSFIPSVYEENLVHNKSASVGIVSGQDFNQIVPANVATPPIPLNPSATTTINITVRTENDKTVRYTVVAERLDFLTTSDEVDSDGNSLIEINYIEDLHAIRYRLDGAGYRAHATASNLSSGCPADVCVGYELTRSLDFKAPTSYRNSTTFIEFRTTSTTWSPIGSQAHPFRAVFAGHGHTIANLTINNPDADNVALFAYTSPQAKISDVRLATVDIVGRHQVGALVAMNLGSIEHSRVDGSISGSREVGSIVGHNASGAKLVANSAQATLKGTVHIGGLVGVNYGVVDDSHADGRVLAEGPPGASEGAGGLVGYNGYLIANSFAINNVNGYRAVGGLVGVNGSGHIAALVVNSYANNTLRGDALVGGLVGSNEPDAQIFNSYADSAVFGGSHSVGGLIGLNLGAINNVYAAGSASGSKIVGGLVGDNRGTITDSYTNAVIAGNVRLGGLVASGEPILVSNSYWDTDVGGVEYSAGGSGFNTSQLQTPALPSVIPAAPYYLWDTTHWYFGNDQQYPQLRTTVGDINIGVACGDDEHLPPCAALLSPYGLASLEILQPAQWSPPFDFSHRNYQVTVNHGEQHIRIISIAHALDAVITVSSDQQSPVIVNHGVESLPLALHQDGATLITIEVDGIVYKLTVDHFPLIDLIKDIDDDDDGLIEINYLEDLHAIRYQPDGTAYRDRSDAPPVTTGCAAGGCRGYELVGDLDFNANTSYRDARVNKPIWTSQHGWEPIGGLDSQPFSSVFKGNGYSISNLTVDKFGLNYIALFGKITEDAEIDGVGLLNIDISGYEHVGGLVGWNKGGTIINSYLSGRVEAKHSGGGLVGINDGKILNSYATGSVISRSDYCGGLVGINNGDITNSYASSYVRGSIYSGTLIGLNNGNVVTSYASGTLSLDNMSLTDGLVGLNAVGSISASYWNTGTLGVVYAEYSGGFNSEALKSPVAPGITITDVYYDWQHTDWDFGSYEHYPALKYTDDENTLLPHQRNGLHSLVLSDQALLFPSFNTHIFDYHIIAPVSMDHIRLHAVALEAAAVINIKSTDFNHHQATPATATIAIKRTDTTSFMLTVQADGHQRVRYRFSVYRTPPIKIDGIADGRVAEGERIRLYSDYRFNRATFDYLWTQVSGPPLLAEATTKQAVLEFTVPPDAVAKDIDYSEAVLRLQIKAGDSVLTKDVSLLIHKRNNGSIHQHIGAPILQHAMLTIPLLPYADVDGIDEPHTITYQWQSLAPTANARWQNIPNATEPSYQIPPHVIDATQYRVLLSYVDKQGYIHHDIDSKVYTARNLDKDNDGLIELSDIKGIQAMRWVLDGRGYKQDRASPMSTVGCPRRGCKGYELITDLNLAGAEVTAIGTSATPFAAVFHGNNHRISNFRINTTGNAIGLFGVVASGGEIDGLGLSSVYVTGSSNVGALVGINHGIVSNSYVNKSRVVGAHGGIGGLVGSNRGSDGRWGIVVNSYADVDVSANSTSISRVGGLVGENINRGIIDNSYAIGDVMGPCSVGGLVGYHGDGVSRITDSYAKGDVTRTGKVAYCDLHNLKLAGGLVGRNNNAIIENSYAIGRVFGALKDRLGGLIGGDYPSIGVKNSYWDITTSGIESSAGGSPKMTIQLQTPTRSGSTSTDVYVGWSDDDWDFGTALQYPALNYGNTATACAISRPHGCRLLLSGQTKTSALTRLILAEDIILVPAFNPETYTYRLALAETNTVEFIPVMENRNAQASISHNDIFITTATSGEQVSVTVEQTTSTLITITLVEADQRPIQYQLHIHRAPTVRIAIVANDDMREGMHLSIDGSGGRSAAELNLLHYNWEQVSGAPLPLQTQEKSDAILDFMVPVDWVEKNALYGEAVLRLTIHDGMVSASEDLSIRIKKINNDHIAIAASRFIDAFTITAAKIDLSADSDGVGTVDDITYQWQAKMTNDWHNILAGTHKNLSLPPNTSNNTRYRVQISYIDGQSYTHTTVSAAVTFSLDVDKDNDGLIEIGTIEGLSAIRYALDGKGYRANNDADIITTGCPLSGCNGYELIVDLDFTDPASYRDPATNKTTWSEGRAWPPIGHVPYSFNAIFDGNGYTISNLKITSNYQNIGLFGSIGNTAEINNIGLLNADINGGDNVGTIAGASAGGSIRYSYAIAKVTGRKAVGGLVGLSVGGVITNSYAFIDILSNKTAGGLVGNDVRGTIRNSYTLGYIAGNIYAGGLIGFSSRTTISNSYVSAKAMSSYNRGALIGFATQGSQAAIINSYWNTDNNEMVNNRYGIGLTTLQLQRPTVPGTTATETYYNWSISDWDFGNARQYPVLASADATLLPYQRIGLLHLALAPPAQLSPNFATRTFYYDVSVAADATQLTLLPVANDAEILINGIATASGRPSHPIALSTTSPVIVLRVNTTGVPPIQYTLNVNNYTPQATVTVRPQQELNEGEQMVLDVAAMDANGDTLTYRWTQNSGVAILPAKAELNGELSNQNDADLSFKIAENLLSITQDDATAELNLTITDGKASIEKNIPLRIIKKNNGAIPQPSSPILRNSRYVAPPISSSLRQDPDGGAYPTSVRYQWQKYERTHWVDIVGETSTNYTPHFAETDLPYRIFVTYTDHQGHRDNIASEKTVFSSAESPHTIFVNIKILFEGLLLK